MGNSAAVLEHDGKVAAGGRILYHAGPLVPPELAIAFGLDLREIAPVHEPAGSPLIARWIDEKEAAHTRSLLAAILSQPREECAALVVTRAFEGAFYYLRELQRLGAADLPMLHMFDLIPSAEERFARYNRHQLRALYALMVRMTGREPDAGQIAAAIETINRRRAQARELHEARLQGRVAGVEAVRFLLGARSGPPAVERDHPAGRSALLLSSEPLHDASLHSALEEMGLRIVAEEDGSGRFGPQPDLAADGDALAAIAAHYSAIATAHTPDREARLAFTRSVLRRGVDAVVCLVGEEDRAFGWDVPFLRAEAEAAGVAFALAPLAEPGRVGEVLNAR